MIVVRVDAMEMLIVSRLFVIRQQAKQMLADLMIMKKEDNQKLGVTLAMVPIGTLGYVILIFVRTGNVKNRQ